MAKDSGVTWVDSAVNPVMGCDGCELWMPERGVKHCYAGTLHQLRGGKVKGYARDFLTPELFPGRMGKAAAWPDLRGTARPDKPWLNGLPRVIFISDMGDALSRNVPFEYLRAEAIAAVTSDKGRRHLWLWLTKQPHRMADFADWLAVRGVPWPVNLWAGTSVTAKKYKVRLSHLRQVPAAVRFVSCEPLTEDLGTIDLSGIRLGIIGGESGKEARPCDVAWIRRFVRTCRAQGCKPFVKQLGANIRDRNDAGFNGDDGDAWDFGGTDPGDVIEDNPNGYREEYQGAPVRIRLRDRAGEDWSEWPRDLRVREWPAVS